MTIRHFNKIMKTIEACLMPSGMGHIYTPEIAKILMNNLEIVDDSSPKCTCQGFYKSKSCPLHGDNAIRTRNQS